MSFTKERLIEYLMVLPVFAAVALALSGTLLLLPVSEMSIVLPFGGSETELGSEWLLYSMAVIVALILTAISVRSDIGLYLLTAFTLGLSILWVVRWDVPKYVAVSLFFLVLRCGEWFLRRFFIRTAPGSYWIPLFAIIMAIVFFLPSPDHPMEWETVKTIISGIEKTASKLALQIKYSLGSVQNGDKAYTGYSGIGLVSGGVSDNDSEELYFSTLGEAYAVYIRGCSFTKATPKGFEDKEERPAVYNDQFAILLNSFYQSSLTERQIRCFVKLTNASVKYKYIRTGDILAPTDTIWLDTGVREGTGRTEGKDFSYKVRYLNIDRASPYFDILVKDTCQNAGEAADYDEIKEYAEGLLKIDLEEYLSRDEYEKAISSTEIYYGDSYLDTSMATDRIRELTQRVTEGAATDYEKAKAIETFLRQYTYDRNTDLRDSANYIEDFLFDAQKGYCVHYASAMVLMLRLSGIPAKYTLGYRHSENSENMVKGSEGHAWAEGYIKGIGWVNFEPTGSMGRAEDSRWSRVLAEDIGETASAAKEESAVPEVEQVAEIQPPEEEEKPDNRGKILYILIVLPGLAVFVAAGAGIHYIRLTPRQRYYRRIERLCRKLDKRFGIRAVSVYDYLPLMEDEEEREKLRREFDRYYRVRYRGDEV